MYTYQGCSGVFTLLDLLGFRQFAISTEKTDPNNIQRFTAVYESWWKSLTGKWGFMSSWTVSSTNDLKSWWADEWFVIPLQIKIERVWADVDVNSAAWISVGTERWKFLRIKLQLVGKMRARAKLRGEITISNCQYSFSHSIYNILGQRPKKTWSKSCPNVALQCFIQTLFVLEEEWLMRHLWNNVEIDFLYKHNPDEQTQLFNLCVRTGKNS